MLPILTWFLSWVQTELGNEAAKRAGMEQAPVTVEQSVQGILSVVCNFPSIL